MSIWPEYETAKIEVAAKRMYEAITGKLWDDLHDETERQSWLRRAEAAMTVIDNAQALVTTEWSEEELNQLRKSADKFKD